MLLRTALFIVSALLLSPVCTPVMAQSQLARIPASFIENKGQTADEVKYYFKGNDTVYFTDEGVVFQKTVRSQESRSQESRKKTHDSRLATYDSMAYRLDFVGAEPTAPEARNKLKAKVAYFKGNDRSEWHNDIPTYQEIVYPDLYPSQSETGWHGQIHPNKWRTRQSFGRARLSVSDEIVHPFLGRHRGLPLQGMTETGGIDLVYKGVPGGMKYEFIVQLGADPDVIKLAYTGIEGLSIDDTGNLIIHTGLGDVMDTKPYCYQEINGKEVEVKCNFKIQKLSHESGVKSLESCNNKSASDMTGLATHDSKLSTQFVYGFELASYNKNYPLIIDPGLEYSTFVGGSLNDGGVGVTVDGSGNAYVSGYSESINFPTTTGAYDTGNNGSWDVVVIKVAPSGTGASDLLYSTYIGGDNSEEGVSVAVDASGDVYLTGPTLSTNFPTTTGAYDTSHNGSLDTFITRLSTTGSGSADLVYSTFIGGSGWDYSYYLYGDGSGNVYITGQTESANFPTTTGAYDTSHNGGMDAFVTKLSTSGSGSSDLLYSTVLGGSGWDEGNGIAVDGSGNVYVAGRTESASFPTTTGAYDMSHNGNSDAFMTSLALTGSGSSDLLYSTFLGGDSDDVGWGVAEDGSGSVYFTGRTESPNFPTTTGAYDTTHNGSNDVFVTKLSPSGLGGLDLLYSTFLGGSGDDYSNRIAVRNGNAYITGYSESINFPTTPRAFDTSYNGDWDVFVSKLAPSGSGSSDLLYSTYLGGNNLDEIWDIAVDGSGNAYVAGRTSSPSFPTTAGAYDTTHNGVWDIFVARLSPETVVCQCQTNSPKGCISGMVTKESTGESLAGKTVKLRRKSPRRPRVRMQTTTDSDGCYQFVDLEDGTYKVKVKKCKAGGKKIVVIDGGAKINDVDFTCRK